MSRLGQLLAGVPGSFPYCASHWVAFVPAPPTGVYGIRVQVRWGLLSSFLDWFLSSMLIVALAAFLRVGFRFVDESQGLVRRRNRVIEQVADEEDPVRH